MFALWIEIFGWMRSCFPRKFTSWRLRFNFIILHYLYLISMAIIASILLYPAGGLAYIDALFFASGAVTQGGLNTVDVKSLYLYQQVVLMIVACMCTPIFINTFVVFVRLYWFEKRFQHIVREARNFRPTRTRSQTRNKAKDDRNPGREECGIHGREIVVLRAANDHTHGNKLRDQLDGAGNRQKEETTETASSNSNDKNRDLEEDKTISPQSTRAPEQSPPFHRDIMFADEASPPTRRIFNLEHIQKQQIVEQHLEFVENQRNLKGKGTLRIPGPRDFDRGDVPWWVEHGDGEDLAKQGTGDIEHLEPERQGITDGTTEPEATAELNSDHPLNRNMTVEEVGHSRRGPRATGFSHFSFGRGGRPKEHDSTTLTLHRRARSRTFASLISSRSQERDPMPYLSWTPTIGRNSAFVDLSEEQREELGGIEYRALKTLAFALVLYYVGFHLLGIVCLLPWIAKSKTYTPVLTESGISTVWWGFFTPASLFNDLGFTLTPDSMISFHSAAFPLLLGSFLIVIGNTGFPCMLRCVIWLAEKFVPHGSGIWEELRFLLDHPRRCFTLLFPSNATWWLFWVLVVLNGLDLMFFVILDLKDPTVTNLPPGIRVLDGLFQACSTRTAGFSVVNLADLHPAIQVSFLIMMYISIFPIAISVRHTNVYEEKSLGVYRREEEDDGKEHSYVGTHLRRQLSFDLWYVFLGFFLITIVEGSRLENTNDYAFTQFSVLFEIVSAYGTVGLSLGYPGINTSFSGEFRTLSKLIIIAMQIRGRHRGLPYALDRAILLPSESLHRREDEDAMRLAQRRKSNISGIAGAERLMSVSTAPTARRESAAIAAEQRSGGQGLSRLLSGALCAGPTVQREREKRA
ncbi:potassium transport protein TRK1/TRK2 [Zopfia rhizophila CBS 207.26]|uniref:Potassium transport protein n=1 Tax=Zopfia rhizophila CBS 207.26 TaxID=1314779 RepID=A0A6A6DEM1_9PEZI|nr:potassium transport protein TRK1/TRK2 [Zopfia rhizophila CBS 207.26]